MSSEDFETAYRMNMHDPRYHLTVIESMKGVSIATHGYRGNTQYENGQCLHDSAQYHGWHIYYKQYCDLEYEGKIFKLFIL